MRRPRGAPIPGLDGVGLRNVASQERKVPRERLGSACFEGMQEDVAVVQRCVQFVIFAVSVSGALIAFVASEMRPGHGSACSHRTAFDGVVEFVVGPVEVLALLGLALPVETTLEELSAIGSDTWPSKSSVFAVAELHNFPEEIATGPFEREM